MLHTVCECLSNTDNVLTAWCAGYVWLVCSAFVGVRGCLLWAAGGAEVTYSYVALCCIVAHS